jgi:hypothetical protein
MPFLLEVLLGVVAVAGAPHETALLGRWDLTFTDQRGRYPSWLEVTEEQGRLTGRFQGRVGHATAIDSIVVTDHGFSFRWPDENQPAAVTRFEGTISGGRLLRGTMIETAGTRIGFRGVRAPKLERQRPDEWAAPVDLLARGLGGWRIRERAEGNGWKLENGILWNAPPSGDLISIPKFTDFKLHLEVNVPAGGNSGIYLRGRHEVQVQDDAGKDPGSRRMGGIYGQVTPTTLPARPAGEWQTFDITLVGRRVTVVLNGVTMIDDQEIPGITGGALDSNEGGAGPLMLQGDHTGVRYRNITIQSPRVR